ncbi:conserved hypothetical protein [Histoplasma capsulatum var. duboisii H88]|uniref:Uncharacterized protein n=1 Tax=Ajellomyces capsulatus (strain H88) TaxID=544711 RepID=F0UA34_AJEC8|nr:conserved hypothetical protein [Histoplasma capsulatum var. duboisii H88]
MPSTVNCTHHHDRKGDPMDMNDDDNNGYESNGTASKSSKKTDLMNSADYEKDSEEDTSNLASLLADDKHPLKHYMEMMANTNRSLLQYNEYTANSLKLLNCIEQKWFKEVQKKIDQKTSLRVIKNMLLNLCYRYIKITLLKNPISRPNNILIEFTIEFIKTFLEKKEDERVLTSVQQLINLKISDDIYQIELHLNPALNKILMFQRSEQTMEQIKISVIKALTYSTIRLWIRCIEKLSAFHNII